MQERSQPVEVGGANSKIRVVGELDKRSFGGREQDGKSVRDKIFSGVGGCPSDPH